MIKYIIGDATALDVRPVIIAHVVNTLGKWGRGFVVAVSRRWSAPEHAYRNAYRSHMLALGNVQVVPVEPRLWIASMVAQEGLRSASNPVPLRNDALAVCLGKLCRVAQERKAAVVMPRIGCGLGGSEWSTIGPIVEQELRGLDVTVYDL